ncbi:hypothetical protein [Cytobacillus horneckiae]|uniref:hypothetical protein n=1 Tax=Cytobacillus horneckiae TaxID=549687 RepID=UPI003D9A19BB
MAEKAKEVIQEKKENFIDRIKNPIFILAATSFAYKVLEMYGVAPELGLYQNAVDLVTWVLIGTGVYSTFGKKN